MSTSTGSLNARNQSNDLGYKEALLIGASLMALTIALVILKFGFYFVLDLCMGLDGGHRRRCVAEYLRKLFPFWHVRTQPAAPPTTTEVVAIPETPLTAQEWIVKLPRHVLTEQDVQKWKDSSSSSVDDGSNSSSASKVASIDPVKGHVEPRIGKMTNTSPTAARERKNQNNSDAGSEHSESSIIDIRAYTTPMDEDLEQQQQPTQSSTVKDQEHKDTTTAAIPSDDISIGSECPFPCSICLQGMHVGDDVYKATHCGHVFHVECLAQWIASSQVAALAEQRRQQQRLSGTTVGSNRRRTIDCPNCRAQLMEP